MANDIESSSAAVLDSLKYAYFEADLSGVLTLVNRQFCAGVGYACDEVIGRHYRRFVDRRDVRRIYQVFNTVYRTGQPQAGIEYNLRRRDGTLGFAEGAVALIRDAAGQPVGFRGVLRDVTDRKRTEAALQHAKQVAERELEIGRQIQAGFLPPELPQPAGWEIASRFEAAREVAGDFYDAFALSGGKRIGLIVADVCGKGVGAALFMALFRSLIRAFAEQHYSLSWMDALRVSGGLPASSDPSTTPSTSLRAGLGTGFKTGTGSVGRRRALLATGATALRSAIDLTNNYIARNHGETHIFATIFFGVLDPVRGTLMYINGGHEPPILVGPAGVKARLEPTGPAVGLFPGLEFHIEQVDLEPGDTLLAFTDGVTDARNPRREFFSEERLLSMAQQPAPSAAALLDHIRASLNEHIAGAEQYDDMTMLAVRRKPASESTSNPSTTLRASLQSPISNP